MRRRRSCTPGTSRGYLARGPGSSATSTPIRSAGSQTSKADITIGGAELAGHALALGLVDECHLFLGPIVVGGGKRALPNEFRAQLELLDERRFAHGVIYLQYRVIV